jgi:hypothetical protein
MIDHSFLYLGFVSVVRNATWASSATTVAGSSSGTAGSGNGYLDTPGSIFITPNDTLYIADQNNNRVVVVGLTSQTILRSIGSGPGSGPSQFNYPNDVVVIGTWMYVLDTSNYRVQKWSISGTSPSTVVDSFSNAFYMCMDKYMNIYVSLKSSHKIIRYLAGSSVSQTVAGTGVSGSSASQLDTPWGITIDDNLTLYIADKENHRIQLWRTGASGGITVAGTGVSGYGLSQLNNPSAITLDTNGYLYISDLGNNRIMRWAPNAVSGVCIAGCTRASGTSSNQLNFPVGVALDSRGSLYVVDLSNNRIQKFQVLYNPGKTPDRFLASVTFCFRFSS